MLQSMLARLRALNTTQGLKMATVTELRDELESLRARFDALRGRL
jgi:hypothetical protein